jgi:hypothetical protein
MQPIEALSASVQVAVTLAGFAGVVVAFRTRSVHEWSNVDKFRLQFLLTNSALPFILSVFAIVLLATKLEERTIWRLCSLFAFICTVISGQVASRSFRSLSRQELATSGFRRWVFYPSAALGIAATLLQLYNVISLQVFWPFLACIATWLWLAMIQFVLLVTAAHDQSS